MAELFDLARNSKPEGDSERKLRTAARKTSNQTSVSCSKTEKITSSKGRKRRRSVTCNKILPSTQNGSSSPYSNSYGLSEDVTKRVLLLSNERVASSNSVGIQNINLLPSLDGSAPHSETTNGPSLADVDKKRTRLNNDDILASGNEEEGKFNAPPSLEKNDSIASSVSTSESFQSGDKIERVQLCSEGDVSPYNAADRSVEISPHADPHSFKSKTEYHDNISEIITSVNPDDNCRYKGIGWFRRIADLFWSKS